MGVKPSPINSQTDRVFRSKQVGPPPTGAWKTDDVVIDKNGTIHRCLLGGSPGTWESSQVVIDETIDFAGNAALFKAMATAIPAGAVILSVAANVESALTGGGTTVKAGIGLNGSDPDAYGLSGALTKNTKVTNAFNSSTPLAGATTLEVCACATNGALGDTALTVGKVRVRVVYRKAAALPDAV